jgi:hypothetical protein
MRQLGVVESIGLAEAGPRASARDRASYTYTYLPIANDPISAITFRTYHSEGDRPSGGYYLQRLVLSMAVSIH